MFEVVPAVADGLDNRSDVVQADFVSGSRELAAAAGSEIGVLTHDALAFPVRQLAGDDELAGGLGTHVETLA